VKKAFRIEELNSISKQILSELEPCILCFHGSMGVGKTTLIKSLIKNLGAVDTGNSPTFGLVNEYHTLQGELIAYHFDFYRIEQEEEALDMGIEEYFDSNAYVFIEWPEKIANLLPDTHKKIRLELVDETSRLIEF